MTWLHSRSTLDALERLIRSTARSPHDSTTGATSSASATESKSLPSSLAPSLVWKNYHHLYFADSASAAAAATGTPSPTSPMVSTTEPGSTTGLFLFLLACTTLSSHLFVFHIIHILLALYVPAPLNSDDSDDDSDDSNTNEVPLQNDDDRPSPCSQQLD